MTRPSLPTVLSCLLLAAIVVVGCDSDDDSSRLSQGVGNDGLADDAETPESGNAENADGSESPSGNSVEACEEFLDTITSLSCWDPAYDPMVDCNTYADTTCDISDYFDCIASAYGCDAGYLTVDADLAQACADLANCD